MYTSRSKAGLGRLLLVLCLVAAPRMSVSAQTGAGATAAAASGPAPQQPVDTRDDDGGSKLGWLGLLGLAGLLGLRRKDPVVRREATTYETTGAGRR